jgi:L-histidine Nalpha-methyltransferase / hercynylcysteine S-oxide synthase
MQDPPITYYALDLEKRELERTLSELSKSELGAELSGRVATKGLCATYDDGLAFIQEGRLHTEKIPAAAHDHYKLERIGAAREPSPSSSHSGDTDITPPSTPGNEAKPFHLLFLGSSLGNFGRGEDIGFLRSLPLEPGSGNTLLLGLDHDNDSKTIEVAYNDPKGVTRDFIMNGLKAAGRTLGDESLFDEDQWEYVGRYNDKLR